MKAIVIYLLMGAAGGVLGGMGMGGGTLLIPLLTMLAGTEQHLAQAFNLIAFVPMSAAALVVHAKNKLVDFGKAGLCAPAALAASVTAALVARKVSGGALGRGFGFFLIALGAWQLVSSIASAVKNARLRRAEEKKKLALSVCGAAAETYGTDAPPPSDGESDPGE